MSQGLDTINDDLAYLSAMARDGVRPSDAGGEILLFCGVFWGAAALVASLVVGGVIAIPMAVLWLGTALIFAVLMPILIVRAKGSPDARRPSNRAVAAAWSSAGFAIFAVIACMVLIGWQTGQWPHLALIAAFVLILYGVAWSVEASLSGRGWNKGLVVACFVAAGVVSALAKWPALMLAAYGAALFILAGLPGLVMMRLHRAARA